ncbi:LysR family transcriptional regulator [Intrasporangium oryzae NRRL B-24470]|uniref:LysR family transcriptional regulator n=1 Tax=Intrasporangium oryzae NRRL B-24470 TaxID=1386089 RepID=W9GFN4_9MICO|nr:LysR family transcriptional regulator [Intrasporangium oryzae]EWT02689.1 LysR family transcriptional regulator [Intrasporangium oryzae NRRL B-24470]
MELDLRLVRYFVALADELHFGRAAAQLYVSQPALSKQIRKLEDQLRETLLVRDSRHVALTARGQQFLGDARRLLALADSMTQPGRQDGVSIAHVFELSTSRLVADAFARAEPDIQLREHAMDSITQLNALLHGRLDVAILRVTPRMQAAHPSGWRHRLLRLEPLLLVGSGGDDTVPTASFHERPLHVFGDPPDSGTYNAHGQYLTALQDRLGLEMRWLGTPGAFSFCVAQVRRAPTRIRYLEFLSYAEKYVDVGMRMFWPQEIQPYYPWSLAWRADDVAATTTTLIEVAVGLAEQHSWLSLDQSATAGPAWMPDDEPAWRELMS